MASSLDTVTGQCQPFRMRPWVKASVTGCAVLALSVTGYVGYQVGRATIPTPKAKLPGGASVDDCSQASTATFAGGKPLKWAGLGDSYSAGVGGPINGSPFGRPHQLLRCRGSGTPAFQGAGAASGDGSERLQRSSGFRTFLAPWGEQLSYSSDSVGLASSTRRIFLDDSQRPSTPSSICRHHLAHRGR